MHTQNEITQFIVDALSPLSYVEKILFSAEYLVNASPYDVTLIIYESCEPNHIATQQKYEDLLKSLSSSIHLNILAVNSKAATTFLDKRLKHYLNIYTRKSVSETRD